MPRHSRFLPFSSSWASLEVKEGYRTFDSFDMSVEDKDDGEEAFHWDLDQHKLAAAVADDDAQTVAAEVAEAVAAGGGAAAAGDDN